MNIFEEIHRTIMTQPDTSDELAILAKDARGLSKDDRALINRAAEELRACYRHISGVHADLHEVIAHRAATSEKLIEMERELDALRNRVAVPLVKPDKAPDPLPGPVTWYPVLSGAVALNGPIYSKTFGG